MDIVIVNFRDLRVRDDDEGKIAERFDAMSKSSWKERKRKVCGTEQRLFGKRRSSMSAEVCQSNRMQRPCCELIDSLIGDRFFLQIGAEDSGKNILRLKTGGIKAGTKT